VRQRFSIIAIMALIAAATLWPAQALAAQTSARVQVAVNTFIDTSLYLPAQLPAPTLLLAHGFGGDKSSVAADAKFFQENGFAVLTWSARGFGKSDGLISMNAQDVEVSDVSKLINDLLARPGIVKRSQGQPLLAISGASYGGAIALLSAAADNRIKAVTADITWSSLQDALFPQSVVGSTTPGPFKKIWAGTFFSLATSQKLELGECGSLAPAWCGAYKNAVNQGRPTPAESALMAASSPHKFLSSLRVPTLLMQGQADSLFPLRESLNNLAVLKKSVSKNSLSLIWHASGHDGGANESSYLRSQRLNFLEKHVNGAEISFPVFQFTKSAGAISFDDSTAIPKTFRSDSLPQDSGLMSTALSNQPAVIAYPIGGVPGAISSLPGIGAATGFTSALSGLTGFSPAFLPAQSNFIDGQVLTAPLSIVGSSRIKVRITSTSGSATLFFSLISRSPSGGINQPSGIVAPVKIENIPASGSVVEIDLPAVVLDAAAGDKLSLGISSTDQGYELPKESAFYSVTALSPLSIPLLSAAAISTGGALWYWPLAALVVVVAVIIFTLLSRPKPAKTKTEIQALVSIENLSKVYKDGYQAVTDLSFSVQRGQVLGLLGPNGAGKTTTLRMLMGLIFPTSGTIFLNGQAVYPGAPALANLGSFVEGSGFLPHLSGRENISLYWKSVGRQGEMYLDEVIEIANLGTALDKKVRSYSQGMRQRLAIAQAMLGMPDLLVLDEPTNGLDPQQIVEMRQVLKDYAATGRTVIVSSHLLTEVQQTCTDVVLMHRGKLVAFGPMESILNNNKASGSLEEIFLELIGDDLIIGKEKR